MPPSRQLRRALFVFACLGHASSLAPPFRLPIPPSEAAGGMPSAATIDRAAALLREHGVVALTSSDREDGRGVVSRSGDAAWFADRAHDHLTTLFDAAAGLAAAHESGTDPLEPERAAALYNMQMAEVQNRGTSRCGSSRRGVRGVVFSREG